MMCWNFSSYARYPRSMMWHAQQAAGGAPVRRCPMTCGSVRVLVCMLYLVSILPDCQHFQQISFFKKNRSFLTNYQVCLHA
jgi:hypothetical protein